MPKRGSAKTHLWGIGGTTVQWGHLGSYCRGELGVWRGTRVRRWGAGRLQRAPCLFTNYDFYLCQGSFPQANLIYFLMTKYSYLT